MNKKKVFIVIIVLILIAILAIYISSLKGKSKNDFAGVNTSATSTKNINFDPFNFTYTIDDEKVSVKNGEASTPIVAGSAENLETTIPKDFIAIGDLNKDGKNDAGVIIVQSSGGSGLFYYLTSIINEAGVIKNNNSMFIGDRILIEKLSIANNILEVSYLDRNQEDSMADDPTVKIKKSYKIVSGELIVVE